MVLLESDPLLNNPNRDIQPVQFEDYRAQTDELAASLHDGKHLMPRTGVFEQEDYENVIANQGTVFDRNGLPLVAPYNVAYPNANMQKYPELAEAGYLMLPLHGLTEDQLEIIRKSSYSEFIGEVTIGGLIDYSEPWGETKEKLDQINRVISEELQSLAGNIDGFRSVEPFDGDGQPILHHVFEVTKVDPKQYNFDDGFIDTISDRELISSKASDLARHHIDEFSKHSISASIIKLDEADKIEEMFADDNWFVVTHLDSIGEIDSSVIVTNSPEEIPWIDKESLNPNGMLAYVDAISTAEKVRGKNITLPLVTHCLNREYEVAKSQGKNSLIIPYDTAGGSTLPVLSLTRTLFEYTGSKIVNGHLDVIAHLLIKK